MKCTQVNSPGLLLVNQLTDPVSFLKHLTAPGHEEEEHDKENQLQLLMYYNVYIVDILRRHSHFPFLTPELGLGFFLHRFGLVNVYFPCK